MNALTDEYRVSEVTIPSEVTAGLDQFVDRAVGRIRRRGAVLDRLRAEAEQVDAVASQYVEMSDAVLRNLSSTLGS